MIRRSGNDGPRQGRRASGARVCQHMAMTAAVAVFAWVGVAAPAGAQEVPFDGVVVQDDVVVRAGAGNAYYEVGRLEQGTTVRVEEVLYGWNRIRPPEGVFSYVSKMNVDAREDGRVGEVNADRVSVTAASVAGPSQSYRRQVVLSQGDRVRIVGEDGSYYKIAPPSGAPVYLPPGSVRRAADEAQRAADTEDAVAPRARAAGAAAEAAEPDAVDVPVDPAARLAQALTRQAATAPSESSQSAQAGEAAADASDAADGEDDSQATPAVASAEGDGAVVSAGDAASPGEDGTAPDADEAQQRMAEIDAAEIEAIETPAVSDAVREVELRNLPFFLQPLEDQPIARMIDDYRRLERRAADLPASDRRLVRLRLAELERNQRLADTLVRITAVRQQVEQRAAEQARAEVEADARPRHRLEDYDVIGKLRASSVYDGRTLPRMFRLIEPGSGRTIAYIQTSEPVQPHRMLGRMVGVSGTREYNQSMGLYVLKVRRIDVLEIAAGP